MTLLYMPKLRLGLRRTVGSSVAFATILLPVAALGRLEMCNVNIGLTLNLVAGSLPGVFIGSKLCAWLPEPRSSAVLDASQDRASGRKGGNDHKPVFPSSVHRWERDLSDEEIARIEGIAGEAMTLMGYGVGVA